MALPDRHRLLYELGAAFAARLDLDDLIPTIVKRCSQLWSASGASVLLLDPATDELYFPYVASTERAVAETLRSVRFPANQGIAGAVLERGTSEAVADVARDPRFYPGADQATGGCTQSLLVAPLVTPRGTIGVIEVINPQVVIPGDAVGEELELLDALAAIMAVAIDNARMFAELRDREARLRSTVAVLRRDAARRDRFQDIVGQSTTLAEVFRLMESAAMSTISVLIVGETGTGKELVARGIHHASERSDAPFVAINCAALPADLLEAELFGHARGAYTGAIADRRGLFEAAHGGTMLLDEIGDLPLAMQVKLLRVLQEGEITPVGTTRPRRVDVRVISATHRDLSSAVREGAFRADLFYRISAFPIGVPPLRERSDDVPLLADRFVRDAAARLGKDVPGIEADAIAALTHHSWPGNVRQLRNEIERAVVLTPGGQPITAAMLTPEIGTTASPAIDLGREAPTSSADLRRARAEFEARFIAEQLEAHDGNVSHTAEAMGISRVMLQKKMKEYGLRDS